MLFSFGLLSALRGCLIRDCDSRAGTWVNNVRLTRPQTISAQDEVVIGDTRIWVHPELDSVATKIDGGASITPTVPDKVDSPPPTNANQDSESNLMQFGALVHERLIQQMDLRRKDVHKMSDEELRRETEQLIDSIMLGMGESFPEGIDKERIKVNVLNEAVGLGPLEKFLEDDSITEIMVNNYKEVFVERNGKLVKSEYGFSGDHAVLSVIERIITPLGRRIDESSPMVDARLKDGSRVNAIIPPLALKGPSLTIRKFSKKKLEFSDLIGYGSVSREMVEFLRICVEKAHKNIIVSGGTGSGKTTLLNVLSSFIPAAERIVTVEDAAELKLDQPNLVSLESKPANQPFQGEFLAIFNSFAVDT